MAPSKSQIDRLGERLKAGAPTEEDLRALDEYRRSFGSAYMVVTTSLRDRLRLEPTGRPAKSTKSIVDKLRRESIRLSQIQDIAGCRLLVTGLDHQDLTVEAITGFFPESNTIDRRSKPSYGYRAVHVVVRHEGVLVEVQIRTSLQHIWAELSEKIGDVIDSEIKYGGGHEGLRESLVLGSSVVAGFEEVERQVWRLPEGDSERSTKMAGLAGAREAYIESVREIIRDIGPRK